MGKPGKREFVQVLRLMELFRPEDVLAGVFDTASFELQRHEALDRETRTVAHHELVRNQRLEVERQLKSVPSQIDPLNRAGNRCCDFAVGLER